MSTSPSALRTKKIRLVVARDGTKCWICGGEVRMTTRPDHPLGGTLDHVIPKSHGGTNNVSNLKLAHRKCNNLRSNKRVTEELRKEAGKIVSGIKGGNWERNRVRKLRRKLFREGRGDKANDLGTLLRLIRVANRDY